MLQYWADKWTAALRSGDYAQTSGFLNRPKDDEGCGAEGCCPPKPAGFCCLGVLTDVVMKSMPEVGKWNEEGRFCVTDEDFGTGDFLPKVIRDITGISASDPILKHDDDGDSVSASSCNDTEKLTFAQIADLIEGQVDEL